MCGISGIFKARNNLVCEDEISKMNSQLAHRGPDGSGVWMEDYIGFGHTRLSIIDLSNKGKQPMFLVDTNRYVITYNGEIYNFKEIKKDLEILKVRFRSNSDTEVVLAAYMMYGDECFNKFNGMFALAIWDRLEKRLILARDRYGIKPLYYYLNSQKFIFASEQKAILENLDYLPPINKFAFYQYFSFQNIFTNETFYDDIYLLEPGTIKEIKYNKNKNLVCRSKQYWDFQFVSDNKLSKNEYEEELSFLLKQAVKRQLVSDVEVGSYLSGGMDSGTISAIASQEIDTLKTFTCGFDLTGCSPNEIGFDERHIAEKISACFGTEHYQYIVKSGDIDRNINSIVFFLEEPRVGQSYPNYCAARLASKFTKVCLSGAGGDELFAGYPWRYRHYETDNQKDFKEKYYLSWQRLTSRQQRAKLMIDFPYTEFEEKLRSVFYNKFGENHTLGKSWEDDVNGCLYFEAKTFLHGLLVVEDKLSMAHGLETRLPFLDNDLVDFASKCPPSFKLETSDQSIKLDENNLFQKKKIQEVKGKFLLRNAMKKILPQTVVELKKQGFSAPDETWFKKQVKNEKFSPFNILTNKLYDFLDFETVKNIIHVRQKAKQSNRLFMWSILYCWHFFQKI